MHCMVACNVYACNTDVQKMRAICPPHTKNLCFMHIPIAKHRYKAHQKNTYMHAKSQIHQKREYREQISTTFLTLKEKLTTERILVVLDLYKSFEVHCDALGIALGLLSIRMDM